jgi:uncharacterized coiled-coil protein SlyX
MARLTDQERAAAQVKKVAQEQAKLADLQKRISARDRKAATQRKIILGGMVAAAMEDDAKLAEQITALARRKLTRVQDKAAFPEWFDAAATDAKSDPAEAPKTSGTAA